MFLLTHTAVANRIPMKITWSFHSYFFSILEKPILVLDCSFVSTAYASFAVPCV